jgi:hypothetical protein
MQRCGTPNGPPTDRQRSNAIPFNVGMIEIRIRGYSNRPISTRQLQGGAKLEQADPEVGANRTHFGIEIGTASALDMFVGPKLCEPFASLGCMEGSSERIGCCDRQFAGESLRKIRTNVADQIVVA